MQLFTFSKRDHVVVCLDCFNKIQKPSGLKNRNFFISLEARSPWSRCWQIWFLVRAFLLACRVSHYVLTRHFLECMQRESPPVFPYKKIINSIGSNTPTHTCSWPLLTLFTSLEVPSPKAATLGVRAQIWVWEGRHKQSITNHTFYHIFKITQTQESLNNRGYES